METSIEESVNELPEGLLAEMTDLVFKSYKDCHIEVYSKFPAPEAKDTLPHYRRAYIDKELRQLCAKYNDQGVASSVETNVGKNCFHTEIRAGQIVLTTSTVPEETKLFRSAKFRNTLARVNQPSLFDMSPYENEGCAYYGTLIHYPDPKDSRYPKFVSLGFPNQMCTAWVEHINLVKYCDIDVSKYIEKPQTKSTSSEETITDTAKPKLKKHDHRQSK